MTQNNDDLFLSSEIHIEKGTLEDRWGPSGYVHCDKCKGTWLCHWAAWYTGAEKGESFHSKCGGRLSWSKEKIESLGHD